MENKFTENLAEASINNSILNKEFNTSDSQLASEEKQLDEIQEMRKELAVISDKPDPDDILRDNIERANRILDTAEDSLANGQITNRFIEVVAALMNAITTAATNIAGQGYNQEVLKQKERALDIKEKEVGLKTVAKQMKGGGSVEGDQNITNNLIITSTREEMLEMIKGEMKEESDT